MKISFTGLNLPEGKIKYSDKNLIALEKKDNPKKVSPFFAEFIKDEFSQADVIVIPESNILDLLILDMEKIESLQERVSDEAEKLFFQQCMNNLEKGIPLCDQTFSDKELERIKTATLLSYKPVVVLNNENIEASDIIYLALEKASYMFFYTSGPKETHAWLVKKNSDIVTCAGKIHTDLARGFIRGDVVSLDDYMKCHNFNDCKAKNLVRVVEKDYIVQPNEIIEIRFNV